MSGHLLGNLLLFGRVLRGLALDANPGRMIDLANALRYVSIGSKLDFYHAARSLLVRQREEIPLFDQAFEIFWRKPSSGWTTRDLQALGERRRFRRRLSPPPQGPAGSRAADRARNGGAPEEPAVLRPTLTYSGEEVLRAKDFTQLTAEEREEVRRWIEGFAWRLAERRARRQRPGRGQSMDLPRTLRRSLRYGGEVLDWARREGKSKPRPLVILADVSGSMEPYTRLLLLFANALAAGFHQKVEAFVFGTRLTRISRQLRGRDADSALGQVSRAVPDWSGGTRIGEALKAFNLHWGRRVLSQGAVVLLISDGWDRGDPDLLAREMARLQRSCHRLIWLNPLLGSPAYEPLARGMRAARPYIDDFLPAHNLASLGDLAGYLAELPAERPARRQQVRFH